MIEDDLGREAQRLYDDRRARDAIFGAYRDGFGEPGWDMLLLLFAGEAHGRAILGGELLDEAGVSPLIAAPYRDWLISVGLAERYDGSWIRITARGRERMERCLGGPQNDG